MTIGRSFLLWLLGVLVVTLVLVSALVLWHEREVLEQELTTHARLLARTLAVATAKTGSPEFLAVISMGDVRAGEVRSPEGRVLWRYGPSLDEVEVLDRSLIRVEEQIQVDRGPWGSGETVEVVLLVSRSRIDRHLGVSAVRLVAALGLALALAMVVGLDLVGRVVKPLRALTDSVRIFQPEDPSELPTAETPIVEVRELTQAYADMAVRLTEQRQSLATSEQRFRDLFTSSPTPLLELDEGFRIRGANPAATSFIGCEAEQAAGRPVAAYLEGDGEGPRLAAPETEGEAVVEARWRLAGGELAEVELHLRPARDQEQPGYLMAIHDLTDRVRRLGERWRRTFDAMVDGVALVDETGDIVLANQALGRHLHALRPLVADQLAGGTPCDWQTQSEQRLLQCSLTTPAGLGHSILVARDVTDAARAESRLREAEKMQAVGTLASGVAHDFNNLLAAILLHLRWLEREPAAANEAGSAIRDLANEGIEVVRELLLFARRESTPPRTFDLATLVAGQQSVLSHLMPEGVELSFRLAEEPVPVTGNPVALRRLLLNLVLNARDALAAEGGDVEVVVENRAEHAVVEIIDDGPGIPPEHQDRIFEPFFSLRRHGRGAGLGLAVVYAIITEHRGDIEVSSDGRSGSRFTIRLPLGPAAELEPAEVIEDGPPVRETERVLLVDDNGREAAHLVEALAAAGLELRHVTTLASARDLVESWSPTAVVSVLSLSDGSTEEFLARLALPAVILHGSEDRDATLSVARSVALGRPVVAERVLAALYRLGVAVAADSEESSVISDQ
jgi:PAS domain S-box-containing protein